MAIAETALEALIRNGVSNSTIKSQGFITINTSRAYETEVTGTYNGKAITMYIVVLTKNGIALMLQGKASNNSFKAITGFKNFADAIVIK